MHTVTDIQEMTREQAQKAFNDLAWTHYGTNRYKTDFANSVGIAPGTVSQWFTDRSQPPAWAFLILQTTAQRDEAIIKLQSIKTALASVPDID